MEDAISSCAGTTSDDVLDIDLMDDLLSGGCWFETTQYSDLFQQGTSAALLDSSCFYFSEINSSSSNPNPPQSSDQDDQLRLVFPDNPPTIEAQTNTLVETQSLSRDPVETAQCSGQLEPYPVAGNQSLFSGNGSQSSELTRRWWIEPRENPGPVSSVKERLIQALGAIKESTGNVLVQIWVPIKRGDRQVLTTCDQPFSLGPDCQSLLNYRTVSVKYQFPAEEDSTEAVGLPGRVFLGRLPEWTPDVQYFSSDEYPRIDHALRNDVRGSLALPVFERCSRVCLGVVEVVMTTQKFDYRPELESICAALKAVNLRSSEVVSVPHLKVSNTYQVVLPEILQVLRAACETHRLPLAQTWVPCMQQGKKGSRHSDENYAICVSTVDVACYVTDPHICRFHEACSEHHLLRGQGVTGEAFTTNQPCFSPDITSFSKTQYPLSHYARMFGLRAAVAIRLRSIYTGTTDYVLEFFLPIECQDSEEQKAMLNSLSMIVQQVCQSLRVVTDKELEDESVSPISEVVPTVGILNRPFGGNDGRQSPAKGKSPNIAQGERKGKSPVLYTMPSECQKKVTDGFSVRNYWCCPEPETAVGAGHVFPEIKQHFQDSVKDSVIHGDSSFSECVVSINRKVTGKRQTKTEKNISLQVLRQYFAGSLKDAAKSIGVCPTTLKRICRQHGITRWPSRKIKKVDHSLKKLQAVINSVQGVDGAFQLSSLYGNFPHVYDSDLTSPELSGNKTLSRLKQTTGLPTSSNSQPEDVLGIHTAPTKSPSSACSQSSSSSLCCSTGLQQHSHACQHVLGEDVFMAENESGVLKRAYSEAELHGFTNDEEKPQARSRSHLSLSEHPSLGRSLYSLLKGSCHVPGDRSSLKVKVTHKDEKVRFTMQPSWGFEDLQKEVAKRFNIDDVNAFNLKYLDDDSEWVLMTCDDDLHECKDIYKSKCRHAVKLSVHYVTHPAKKNHQGSSVLQQ